MKETPLPGTGPLKKLEISLKRSLVYPVKKTIHSLYRNNFYPKLLVNSIPKSGTHLLAKVINNMGFKHAGQINHPEINNVPSHRLLTMEEIEQKMKSLKKGRYVVGHKSFDEDFDKLLRKNKFSHILIVRDPRDVAVSKAFYLLKKPEAALHAHFTGLSERERFIACINGVPERMRSIAEIYNIFMPWLNESSCLMIKFEDLVGSQGGGSDEKQSETLGHISGHLGLSFDESKLKEIALKSFNKNSVTFRKGKIGDWANWLDDEMLSILKKDEAVFQKFGYTI